MSYPRRIDEEQRLKREIQAMLEAAVAEDEEHPPPPVPKPKVQRNFTDPESRIMLNSDKAFVQAYNAGAWPERVSTDAGYWSDAAVGQVEAGGSTAYVAPKKIGNREWRELAPAEVSERVEGPLREPMWHRLRTEEERAEYHKRKISVEPAIGQLKTVQGGRQFLLRGAQKVQSDWLLACTGHNILKLFRAHQRELQRIEAPGGGSRAPIQGAQ